MPESPFICDIRGLIIEISNEVNEIENISSGELVRIQNLIKRLYEVINDYDTSLYPAE